MHYETNFSTVIPFGRVGKFACVLIVLGMMTACGKKTGEEKAGQSLVRVNGEEITIHQLNNELQRANVQTEQQEQAGKQIVQKLVDRQILVQEALKTKLDRNPRVMQAIENAKMQILAQAYLEDKMSSVAKPTEAEISDYHASHTNIFANRKIYVMDEIAFAVEASKAPELEAFSDSAKTLDDVIQWLSAHQVKYARSQAAHAAETLPPELLAKLNQMAVGDIIFINAKGRTVVGRMVETKEVPISEADAKPLVERILTVQKRKQVADAEMARLRNTADIEYINKKFEPDVDAKSGQSATKPITPAKSAVITEPPAKPAAPAKPADDAKPADEAKIERHIEKGLSGL